ncbi:MAG: TetR/AcrR family transcriptional regulator [Acidimicrobiia bacterium]|nr:TetR/AcrR family transcriptional regulator [Acidimicrobiia bacterium]
MARRDVKTQMIEGASELLATHGVQGTSFALVLEATGAPRGSIYHHFPGGKNELVVAAVCAAGATVTALIDAVDAETPEEVVRVFVGGWRATLKGGRFERGCAIAAASQSTEDEPDIRAASHDVFTQWRLALSRALIRSGADPADAGDQAALLIAAVEGALLMGRAARDDEIFDVLERRLPRLVE